jgi:hypothetical protein
MMTTSGSKRGKAKTREREEDRKTMEDGGDARKGEEEREE